MTDQPKPGELLVGAYLRRVEKCELVMYNQRSREQGDQFEIDVIGVKTTDEGRQEVYVCEVVTHLGGLSYSGTPDTERWVEFGNDNYQHALERIWRKFQDASEHVTTLFDDAEFYSFQLWSPVVPGDTDEKYLLGGLHKLSETFEEEVLSEYPADTQMEHQLVINDRYSKSIDKLWDCATEDTKDYGERGLRFLQILARTGNKF